MTQLTEDEFQAIKFIPNHIDLNASWEDEDGVGIMFETYGEELDFVKSKIEENKVWTYIDTEGGSGVYAGYHFVNRIGYFISEEPWPDLDTYYEWEDEHDEDYEFKCTRCECWLEIEDWKCENKDTVCNDCCDCGCGHI